MCEMNVKSEREKAVIQSMPTISSHSRHIKSTSIDVLSAPKIKFFAIPPEEGCTKDSPHMNTFRPMIQRLVGLKVMKPRESCFDKQVKRMKDARAVNM